MAEAVDFKDEFSALFERAADRLTTLAGSLSSDKLLYLYARFKQAKEGSCNIPKPGYFNFQAKQKWEAWKSLGDMDSQQAMQEYVEEIRQLDPDWVSEDSSGTSKKTGLGLAVSTLRGEDCEILRDDQKNIFDWVKEGNVEQVGRLLTSGKENSQQVDEEGMSLLHWASDRGYSDLVKLLLKYGANINQQDVDGQTALHYASSCGHPNVVQILISEGADRMIVDSEGLKPADVASDSSVASLINR